MKGILDRIMEQQDRRDYEREMQDAVEEFVAKVDKRNGDSRLVEQAPSVVCIRRIKKSR